jgi:hypothetical protein
VHYFCEQSIVSSVDIRQYGEVAKGTGNRAVQLGASKVEVPAKHAQQMVWVKCGVTCISCGGPGQTTSAAYFRLAQVPMVLGIVPFTGLLDKTRLLSSQNIKGNT